MHFESSCVHCHFIASAQEFGLQALLPQSLGTGKAGQDCMLMLVDIPGAMLQTASAVAA